MDKDDKKRKKTLTKKEKEKLQINIYEVHYTQNFTYKNSQNSKAKKYKALINILIKTGWKKRNINFHCLTFDILAYWNKLTETELSKIGFNKRETNGIMTGSQKLAFKYLSRQISTRNKQVHSGGNKWK